MCSTASILIIIRGRLVGGIRKNNPTISNTRVVISKLLEKARGELHQRESEAIAPKGVA